MLNMRNRVASLQKRSKNTLSIFKTTIDNLSKINSEISKEIVVNNKKVISLESEIKLYRQTLNQNERVVGRLNDFLSL